MRLRSLSTMLFEFSDNAKHEEKAEQRLAEISDR
jgi:hypothetical protein